MSDNLINSKQPKVKSTLQDKYNDYYDGEDEWRRLGAIDKVEHILELCADLNPKNILEVGSGEGSILQRLAEFEIAKSLSSVEISKNGVEIIKQRNIHSLKEVNIFDGYNLPYKNDEFDLIISTHVLEHVEHERMFLKELSRVGKNIFIEVPLEDTLRVSMWINNNIGHINFYNKYTLHGLIKTCDMKLIKDKVYDHSLEIMKYQNSNIKALIKYFIRRFSIKFFPKIASKLFTYHYAMLLQKID